MIDKRIYVMSIIYGLLTNKEFTSFVCENYPLELYKHELDSYTPVYEGIYYIYDKKKDIPTKQEIKNFLDFYYQSHEGYSDSEKLENYLLIDKVEYEDCFSYDYALEVFKKFLTIIKINIHFDKIRYSIDKPEVVAKITEDLNKDITSIANANVLSDYKLTDNFLDNLTLFNQPSPLGYHLFDYYTEGFNSSEVNLLVAPSGTGKTLIGINSVIDSANYCLEHRIDELSVFVTYETPRDEVIRRCLSCASIIPRERLLSILSRSDLPDNIFGREYEYKYLKYNLLKDSVSEQERLEHAKNLLKNNVIIVDFSGSDGRGFSGVNEISSFLKEIVKREKKKIRLVVIDWLGLMVERYLDTMASNKKDSNLKTNVLRYSIDFIRTKIAKEFGCVVWVNHQLSGEATGRPPYKDFHISDAAECKSLHIFADFALVIGTLFKEPVSCARVFCEKARRTSQKDSCICTFLGEISRCFIDHNLILERSIGKVVDKTMLKKEQSKPIIYDES